MKPFLFLNMTHIDKIWVDKNSTDLKNKSDKFDLFEFNVAYFIHTWPQGYLNAGVCNRYHMVILTVPMACAL